jgi:NADH-quinone oxidoreductase subunit K
MTSLQFCLLVSAFLFATGFAGAVARRHAIIALIGVELMLNAANLNLIAFWRFGPHPEALTGFIFTLFSIGLAAAEAAVGLALVIAIYRHKRTSNLDEIKELKG